MALDSGGDGDEILGGDSGEGDFDEAGGALDSGGETTETAETGGHGQGVGGRGGPEGGFSERSGGRAMDSAGAREGLRTGASLDRGEADGRGGLENGLFGLHNRGNLERGSLDAGRQEYSAALSDVKANYSLSPEKLQALESREALSRVRTLSSEKYQAEFPGQSPRVLGCHDPETGALTFRDTGDREALRHVATHEVMHKASYGECTETENGTKLLASGLRRTEADENGRVLGSKNLCFNEGLTERYTIDSLERRGETESVEAVTAYVEARQTAEQLGSIVGNDRLEAAYFRGELSALEAEVNRLAGEDGSWNRLSGSLDALYNAETLEEQTRARTQVQAILYRIEAQKNHEARS